MFVVFPYVSRQQLSWHFVSVKSGYMAITPKRKAKLVEAASNRQLDITVVLENVHDPHNMSAVVRTCDSVGIGGKSSAI